MDTKVTLTTSNIPPTALLSHTDWVRRLAQRLVRDAAAAEDLTQETLLAALRGRPRNPAALRPWLAGIARNLARKETRGRRKRHDVVVDATLEALQTEGNETGQEALLARAEAHRALVEHVLDLPEPSRGLLLQRYFEGRRPAEIAELEGSTPASVSSGLTRAHALLRERLERTGGPAHWLTALGPLLIGPKGIVGSAAASGPALGTALGAPKALLPGARWGWIWFAGFAAAAALTVALVMVWNQPLTGPPSVGERTAALTSALEKPLLVAPTADPPRRTANAIEAEPEAAPSPSVGEEAVVAAAPRANFEARCVDGFGLPIPSARVQLVRALDGRPEYHTAQTKDRLVTTAVTDLNGRIQLESIESGSYVLGRVPVKGETTAWLRPVEISAESPQRIPPDIPLVDTEWLVGTVQSTIRTSARARGDGAGLVLTAFRTGLATVPEATVQADGSFRIGPLVPGSFHLSSVTTEDVDLAVQTKVVQSAPLEQVSAKPIRLLAVESHTFVGQIDAERVIKSGQVIDSRSGQLRVGAHSSSSAGHVRWAGACCVQPDGSFRVSGLPSGSYSVAYTSDDGTLIAKGRVHTARRRTLRLNKKADAKTLARAIRRCRGEIEAEPAAIAWVYSGRYASRGPLTIEVQHDARDLHNYPMGPLGALRLVTPSQGARLTLTDEGGARLKTWKVKAKKPGEVLRLEP